MKGFRNLLTGIVLWALLTVAVAMIWSNDYPIVEVRDDVLIVDRKGELITFVNVTPNYVYGKTLRIYMDFDWAFRGYNSNIK